MNYPTYYRQATRCLKRESDTTAIEVKIPGEGKSLPVAHHPVTFPDKQRLDEEVSKMQQVDRETYEDYLSEFFKASDRNRHKYNAVRQARFDKKLSELNSK